MVAGLQEGDFLLFNSLQGQFALIICCFSMSRNATRRLWLIPVSNLNCDLHCQTIFSPPSHPHARL
jgi:hypothetical protein